MENKVDFNILVTSISRKVSLLKCLRQAILKLNNTGKIYGGDIDSNCIGRYFVDCFWNMPELNNLTVDGFINYCAIHRIKAVIPTRDGELPFFSKNICDFRSAGIEVMVSHHNAVQKCLDKLEFYKTLQSMGFPAIVTSLSTKDIDSVYYVVKERLGAGSCSIGLQLTEREAIDHARKLETPIFQPFVLGREYSADLYIDIVGCVRGVVIRSRDKVVGGESQITTSLRDERLETACSNLAKALNLFGHVVFQIIVDLNGDYHFIECNSRFGGASSLSQAVGLESLYWFLLEVLQKDLDQYPFVRATIEKKQIRYSEDLIIDDNSV